MVKYKNLTKHFPAKMRDNRDSHSLLVGLQNGGVNSEEISYRAKHCHTTWSNNYTPRLLDQQTKVCQHNGILFKNKKKWAVKSQKEMDETWMKVIK